MTNQELLTKIDKNAAYIRERRPLSLAEFRCTSIYFRTATGTGRAADEPAADSAELLRGVHPSHPPA